MYVHTYYATMETQLNGAQVFLLLLINSVLILDLRALFLFLKLTFLYSALYIFFTESFDPKPTSKAKKIHKWNWIILGIVIGLIALNIIILVAGVL